MSFVSCGCALPEKIFRSPKPVAISPAPLSGGRFMFVWLGRKDSNLRIRDPKTRALPLGHAPVRLGSLRNRPPALLETLSVDEVNDYQQIRLFTLPGARFPVRVRVGAGFQVPVQGSSYRMFANARASSMVLIRRSRRFSAKRRRSRPTARVNGTGVR